MTAEAIAKVNALKPKTILKCNEVSPYYSCMMNGAYAILVKSTPIENMYIST